MLASVGLAHLCNRFAWDWLSEGFRIILLTVVISLVAALLFPIKEEKEQEEVRDAS
jgi:hypothetical protein